MTNKTPERDSPDQPQGQSASPSKHEPRQSKAPQRSSASALWRRGEELAAKHLESLGYRIIARNWRSPQTRNEIDLIALDGQDVVFVEVKTARTETFGDPLGWITPRKQRAIITAARAFVAEWPDLESGFRFDVITVGPPDRDGHLGIHHLPSAFTWDEV